MRKINEKSIKILTKFALPADELKKIKGGTGETHDAQGNIIIQDVIDG